MKKNIIIIGYGVSGQRFFKYIKKIKKFNILKIIVKTKRKIFYNNKNICGIHKDIKNLNNLNAVIIATPFNISFKYAKYFLQKKIPILIEKPFCQTILQSKKILNLQKKNNSSFLINYSDLYDPKYIKLINIGKKKIKKIKTIIANYGNNRILYPIKKKYYPIQNWISHPVSIFISLFGQIKKFKIISYEILHKNNLIFERVKVRLIKKNLNLIFSFSNFPGEINRNIKVIGEKGFFKFNSYVKKDNFIFCKKKLHIDSNKNSIENILNIFLNNICKKNIKSNINIGVKEQLLSTNIIKSLTAIRKNALNSK